VETHISTLFFTPDRVYKLLKPVRTGFLDHTDRSVRIAATETEFDLNRRIAPDVYLGLGDLIEGDELVDRLLIMRRLPAERCLSALVTSPQFSDHLRAVARQVAAFHARLVSIHEPVPLSTAEGLRSFWHSSADEIRPSVGDVIDADDFDAVARFVDEYLDHHVALFDSRRADGWVRDGHGDLIADDIFMLDDGPRILDCLAFDREYRVTDVLADIGFLVMDIERIAGRAAAHRLMQWYGEFTAERHPSSLAHHYVAYRAHVRAKVAVIRHRQGQTGMVELARTHHAQALEHLRRARGNVVLVGGGPGTGKTSLTNALAERLNWVVIDSDTVRKDLFRIDHDDHDVAAHPELYSVEATEATYTELTRRAQRLIDAGESVILDATFTRHSHRAQVRRMADAIGARTIEFECVLDLQIAKRRIQERTRRGGDVSDATTDEVDRLAARDTWPSATAISTDCPIEEAADAAVAQVLSRP
jgi:aminoglycoside phosphotransferase family enzyme/predicted kinase